MNSFSGFEFRDADATMSFLRASSFLFSWRGLLTSLVMERYSASSSARSLKLPSMKTCCVIGFGGAMAVVVGEGDVDGGDVF